MNWTIGFITNGQQYPLLQRGIESVRREMPDAQLVLIGGEDYWQVDTHVQFDENVKPGWITRKKNLIAQVADHDNIAILHDYLALEPGWGRGVESFGDDWLTCMHKVVNHNGGRYRDWCVIYNDAWMDPPIDNATPPECVPGRSLQYSTRGYERWQYYSGSYFCAKKQVMLDTPLDEDRTQGGGEDVQWSRLLYQKYGEQAFTMNTLSSVRLLKQKPLAPWQHLPCL